MWGSECCPENVFGGGSIDLMSNLAVSHVVTQRLVSYQTANNSWATLSSEYRSWLGGKHITVKDIAHVPGG